MIRSLRQCRNCPARVLSQFSRMRTRLRRFGVLFVAQHLFHYSRRDCDGLTVCGSETFMTDFFCAVDRIREYRSSDRSLVRLLRGGFLFSESRSKGAINRRDRIILFSDSCVRWRCDGILYFIAYVGYYFDRRDEFPDEPKSRASDLAHGRAIDWLRSLPASREFLECVKDPLI
jgi:hypothetical protein